MNGYHKGCFWAQDRNLCPEQVEGEVRGLRGPLSSQSCKEPDSDAQMGPKCSWKATKGQPTSQAPFQDGTHSSRWNPSSTFWLQLQTQFLFLPGLGELCIHFLPFFCSFSPHPDFSSLPSGFTRQIRIIQSHPELVTLIQSQLGAK